MPEQIVQFAPFSSLVQPPFWHELTRLKIDVLKLSQDTLTITANYSAGRLVLDRESGKEVPLGCNLSVAGEGFQEGASVPLHSIAAPGTFKNFNTIEEFKSADKAALFNEVSDQIWEAIKNNDPSQLNRFLLITFADLKKYKYYYWFAFPAFVAKPAWVVDESGWRNADEVIGEFAMQSLLTDHRRWSPSTSSSPYFLLRPPPGLSRSYDYASDITSYDTFFANTPPTERIIGFVDPSALPQNPGWPLRNLLAYIRHHFGSESFAPGWTDGPDDEFSIKVLCLRDTEVPTANGLGWKSKIGVVSVKKEAPGASAKKPTAVGWEKNPAGKIAPRVADLAPMMDPRRLADQAVDLNLKLMRWRILPELDLEKVAETKCLLLGAGTLGCYVARSLMGWGVRTITFVDSARVSFSNPVRQPLFEFTDSLDGGKPKAQCAADALKRIFPGVNATGHSLSIPMPGHPIPPPLISQTKQDISTLETLIDAHDAIFLLMDSRESRWLPTVMGSAKGKMVINAALGFDTYLVMRHGARGGKVGGESADADGKVKGTGGIATGRLGCYYCNDIVAPADSLTDRTLDQMCTVTRPGLAAIASATAVELLISMIQHPAGINAPAPPPDSKEDTSSDDSPFRSVLGLVPHQLRGFLAQFRTMPIVGAAYDRCTGCSETVLQAYEQQGFDVLLKAFNEPGFLESLTGLDKLHDEGEAAMESVDWEEEDDDF